MRVTRSSSRSCPRRDGDPPHPPREGEEPSRVDGARRASPADEARSPRGPRARREARERGARAARLEPLRALPPDARSARRGRRPPDRDGRAPRRRRGRERARSSSSCRWRARARPRAARTATSSSTCSASWPMQVCTSTGRRTPPLRARGSSRSRTVGSPGRVSSSSHLASGSRRGRSTTCPLRRWRRRAGARIDRDVLGTKACPTRDWLPPTLAA